VAREPEPIGSRSAFWAQSIHSILDEDMRSRFLEAASQRETDHLDTHPALSDRLAAIGIAADNDAARKLTPPATSAAAAWLGSNMEAIKAEFDHDWRQSVGEQWRNRHAYLQERQQRLVQLETATSLSTDEQWERISILDELTPEADLLPLLNKLLMESSDHLSARFRRGTLLLQAGDETGMDDLEQVMEVDADAILAGCEAAWNFYRSRSPQKAEHYSQRWQERSDYLNLVQVELQTLPADAQLAPAHLDEHVLDAIRQILREHGKHIRKAYVMRRILKTDSNVYDHVLAFETSRLTLGDKGPAVVKRLVQQQFPLAMFVVHLGTAPYKRFRKSIKKMKIPPLSYR
jgi:hypothetical protein